MAHVKDRSGGDSRSQQPHNTDKVPPSSIMHRSSSRSDKQRMLNRFKLPTPKITQQNVATTKQNTPTKADHNQKKKLMLNRFKLLTTPKSSQQNAPTIQNSLQNVQTKLDGFPQKNNHPNLTISTTTSTCKSASSLFGQSYSDSYDSWDASYASFEGSPTTPSDADLFSEWLQLHACSGETAPSHTFDDEVYEQVELRRTRASNEIKSKPSRDQQADDEKMKSSFSRDCQSFDSEMVKSTSLRDHRASNEQIKSTSSRDRHSDNEAINSKKCPRDRHSDNEAIKSETPRDLLSGNYYSFASSADTMSPMNNRIQTPSEIVGTSCSFNFDSVALSLLKSADKSFKSQIEIVNDFLVGEEYYDSCDDNSSYS